MSSADDLVTAICALTVGQLLLDELAVAWSELDRCRPQRIAEIPAACRVVRQWATSALSVDSALMHELQATYVVIRAEEEGGPQVDALRWVWTLVEAGHDMTEILQASDGPERLFWELYWRSVDELPAGSADGSGRERYVQHLDSRPVREAGSVATTFLLRMAMHLRTTDEA